MTKKLIEMDDDTYRLFVACAKQLNCKKADLVLAMAVEALKDKLNLDTAIRANKKFIEEIHDSLLHPTATDSSNSIFTAAPGDEENVYSLCANKVNWGGNPAVITCWAVTPDHLRQIKKDGKIFIGQMGERPNPVAVSVKDPTRFKGIEIE